MKTVSPHTIGDDQPCPGTATFQRMFSVVDHFSGMPAPGAMPLMSWPRNPGHVSSGFGFADERGGSDEQRDEQH